MEYRTYARILWRRWPLIAALALLAAAAAYGRGLQSPRLYRATAQLSVTPSVVEFFTGEAVQRLLNNYALRLKSRPFAEVLAARLQPPATAGEVIGKVRAVAAPPEYRIAIEVDDIDPARAQQIANAAAAAFVDQIRAEIAGKERHDISIDILERADLPEAPISPRPKRDSLGAAILGGLIGGALAFLLEFWDNTVRSAAEAASLFDLPVLGAIPRDAHSRPLLRGRPIGARRSPQIGKA